MATELKIMRFIEVGDFERRATLPEFHGFVWNHSILSPVDARTIANERSALSLAYFNVLDRGLEDWASPWFDWLRANTTQLVPPPPPTGASVPVMRLHDLRPQSIHELSLHTSTGDPADEIEHAITWYGRDMIDWPHMTFIKVSEMVATMRNTMGGDGLYFDQYWRHPVDWMFSLAGAPYSAFPSHWWGAWRWALDYAVQFAGMVTSGKVWANGDHSARCARIYEHAELDYDATVADWRADYAPTGGGAPLASVLTVDANAAPWAVDRAIADWTAQGHGWLGFTTQSGTPEAAAKVDSAYAAAAVASAG